MAWLLLASTTRWTPARRAASSAQYVPSMLAWLIAGQVDSPDDARHVHDRRGALRRVDHRGEVGDVGDQVLLAGPDVGHRDDVQAAHRPAPLGQPAAQPGADPAGGPGQQDRPLIRAAR